MTTIELNIPDPVFLQAQELARNERIPVDELLSMAVAQVIGAWANEKHVSEASRTTGRQIFIQALDQALRAGQRPSLRNRLST